MSRKKRKDPPLKTINWFSGLNPMSSNYSGPKITESDKTRTKDQIETAEKENEARIIQEKNLQQKIRAQQKEIKAANENPIQYASNNPLTTLMQDVAYNNEQNPQTWYRPGYMYQGPYFSPEVQQQAKNDMLNYAFLTMGAANPATIPYLVLEPALDLADADQNTKDVANYLALTMPVGVTNLWNNARNAVSNKTKQVAGKLANKLEQYSNKTTTVAEETAEELSHSPIVNSANVTFPSDVYYLTGNASSAQKYASLLDKNMRMPYLYTTQETNAEKLLKKLNTPRRLRLRGSFDSDVFVPKSLIVPYKDQFKNIKNGYSKTIKFKPVKRQSSKFKNSLSGIENPNPKDYYRVSFNQLLQSESPAFKQQELRDIIFNQVKMAKNGSNNIAQMGLYYNPRTVRLGNHFWPIGYGNLNEIPLARRIGMNTLLSDVNLFGITPILGRIGINKYQQLIKQPSDYLNSANPTDEDQIGLEFADKMTPKARLNLQKAVNAYVKYDAQDALKQIDSVYKDVPGYKEYKNYLIKRNNYASGGPLKRDQYYNTILTPEQEKLYQSWVNTLPINLRGDYDYDLRGAWLNGDKPNQYGHMPDTWKKPWHPTFSNESIYSQPGAEGGRWDGEEFHPSQYNNIMRAMGKYVRWGANSFTKGGPKKTYTAEQLAAMAKAQRDAELAGMNPMSRTYNGSKTVTSDKTNVSKQHNQNVVDYSQPSQQEQYLASTTDPSQMSPAVYPSQDEMQFLINQGIAEKNKNFVDNTRGEQGLQNISPTLFYMKNINPLSSGIYWGAKTLDNVYQNPTAKNFAAAPFLLAADLPSAPGILSRYARRFGQNLTPEMRKQWIDLINYNYDRKLKEFKPNRNGDWDIRYYNDFDDLRKQHFILSAPETKALDEKGQPLKLFIGASEPNINIFGLNTPQRSSYTNVLDKALYLTPNRDVALQYAQDNEFIMAQQVEHLLETGAPKEYIAKKVGLDVDELKDLIKDYNIGNDFLRPITDPNDLVYALYANIPHGRWVDNHGNSIQFLKEYQIKNINESPAAIIENVNENVVNQYGIRLKPTIDFLIKDPRMIKSTRPITYTENGEPIPLRYRDDFSNYDINFSKGGPIHIKPENRGKFTAAAKRVGKSVQEYASQILANKDHYSSTLVKRANFARNFGGKK